MIHEFHLEMSVTQKSWNFIGATNGNEEPISVGSGWFETLLIFDFALISIKLNPLNLRPHNGNYNQMSISVFLIFSSFFSSFFLVLKYDPRDSKTPKHVVKHICFRKNRLPNALVLAKRGRELKGMLSTIFNIFHDLLPSSHQNTLIFNLIKTLKKLEWTT